MKRVLILSVLVFLFFFAVKITPVFATEQVKIEITPQACPNGTCPNRDALPSGEKCASSIDEFKSDSVSSHYWIVDPDITTQGKADERARQFIYWTLNKNAIDDHQVIRAIWGTTKNVALFLFILVVAILGLVFIIGQRTSFQKKIDIWPTFWKIMAGLLYIVFSYAIVMIMIQLSEILMKFFIENLGGKDLFNIYFSASTSGEQNYINFVGCRDLNLTVQEAAKSEVFLLKLTNITYYVMGVMVILRKILLWFLLFIAPFLAILFPFVFIRNVAWIWIGVFFQWLFYGPLFAIFLGALSTIWKAGIPFTFDFSRVDSVPGYIYPTAINILYGGPAQNLKLLNSGNYIDTFAEYVITLIMLWAVIFFPWWLLRIFRDYCCDGINAVKNILLSLYDQSKGSPPPPIPSSPISPSMKTKTAREMEMPIKIKLETIEEVRKTTTEDINRSLNLTASKLTDIARFETNKETRENITKNLNYLKNPVQAETPIERQKFMNIRSELFNRTIKDDKIARQVLTSISTSKIEQMQKREEFLKTTSQVASASHIVSSEIKIPQEKIKSITTSFVNYANTNESVINNISQISKVENSQVKTILSSLSQNIDQSITHVAQKVATTTGVTKEKVVSVFKAFSENVKTNKDIAKVVAQKENIKVEEAQKIAETQIPIMAEPEKHIEKAVSIPPTVSIEEYEEVKKMWVRQYEKGEVPIMENIKTRGQWVEQDEIMISNTLNKLLSEDQNLRQQGLDDVGYILPIFLINNLKADELVVYLKAKLEAAKQIGGELSKEKEITEKLKAKSEEEFVDVDTAKKEEKAKEMTLSAELEINPETPEKPEDKPEQKIEQKLADLSKEKKEIPLKE